MRVGEKETSEQAEIVRRYADLFSREQLEALARGRGAARRATSASCSTGCARPARAGSISARSSSARTSSRTACSRRGSAFQRRGAAAAHRPGAARRARLATPSARSSARSRPRRAPAFNPDRLELLSDGEELEAELSGIAERGRAKRGGEGRSRCASSRASLKRHERGARRRRYVPLRDRWFERLLGPGRAAVPSSFHIAYMRRLSPLESTYTKERATEVCLATLARARLRPRRRDPNIKLDLDDRPQKAPRACVIPSDPPSVVHLITRAQGGLHDYQAFLHEAGHALHYGGVDPSLPMRVPAARARPCADRDLLLHRRGDLARARVARPLLRPLRRGGRARTPRRRCSSRRCSSAATRRSSASSSTFWSRFAEVGGTPDGYEEYLTAATGIRYRSARLPLGHGRRLLLGRLPPRLDSLGPAPPPPDRHRRRGLVAQPGDRRAPRASSSVEGTRPSSEEIAARIGYDPLDTAPLLHELGA